MIGIYSIRNTKTGHIYIGSTIKKFEYRWNDHIRALTKNEHRNKHLQSAWNKYGKDMFVFDVVEEIQDKDKVLEAEQFYIDIFFGSKCYNMCPNAAATLGRKHSKETKEKMSIIHKGSSRSEETKRKMSLAQMGNKNGKGGKGRTHSEESKQKISVAKKGKTPWNKGKTLSEETKKKISLSLQGSKYAVKDKVL